jgi:hypothetical protein
MFHRQSLLVLGCLLATSCHGFRQVLPSNKLHTNLPSTRYRQQGLLLPQARPSTLPNPTTCFSLGSETATLAAEAVLDLGRLKYRLESMATYSTITALVMNACLRLYTSQKFAKDPDTGATRTVQHIFTALSIVCIIAGVFTAVLFNILGIYSKECLGMHNDAGYVAFQAATAIHRKWGFRTFLTTCLSFVGSFLLSVYENAITKKAETGRTKGLWIFAVAIILAAVAAFEIQRVLSLATQLIYTAEFKARHEFA